MNELHEIDSQPQTSIDEVYYRWLSLSLFCAAVDVGYFGWRVYVTVHPLPGGVEGLEAALLGMLIYGSALIVGTICGVLAAKAGGFKKRLKLAYIGIAAGPLSIVVRRVPLVLPGISTLGT